MSTIHISTMKIFFRSSSFPIVGLSVCTKCSIALNSKLNFIHESDKYITFLSYFYYGNEHCQVQTEISTGKKLIAIFGVNEILHQDEINQCYSICLSVYPPREILGGLDFCHANCSKQSIITANHH